MARVLIRTQAWGTVQSHGGGVLPGLSYVLKNIDGSAATHWSAETGGTSSTASMTTDADGGPVLAGADRWVEQGEYDLTVNGRTYRVMTTGTSLIATYSVLAYGGVCDAKRVTDGVISGGTLNKVSSTAAAFTNADVGKTINIDGAAAGGTNHGTTIASVAAGVATLTLTASTAVSGATVTYGTDDTAALQAASNAATAAPLGGTVLIPGDTMITTITPGSNIAYTAAPGSTIYQAYNYTANVNPMFYVPAVNVPVISNVRFLGLWLEGDGNPLVPHAQGAIYISPGTSGTDIEVSDCKLNNHAEHGILVSNCDVVTVERNRLTNVSTVVGGPNAINIGPGAGSSVSGDWTITSNRVIGGQTAGINIYSTGLQGGYKTRALITGNIVRGRTGWAGIVVEANGGCNDVTVTGNGVYDCLVGIEASNTNSTWHPTYADMRNLVISGNTVDIGSVSGSQGILISSMSNTTVSGNTVRAAVPLVAVGQDANTRITGVTITGNTFTYGGLATGSRMANISFADRVILAANAFLAESEIDWLTLGNASAGTFTLTVTDNHAHSYGPTAGIAWNAAPSAVQSALRAVLPAAISSNITVTGSPTGLPGGSVEIVFTGSLGGQPITLTGNFAGLTGGAGVITRTVPGPPVSGHGIFINDVYDTTVIANTVSHAGLNGMDITDARDSVIAQNTILDPAESNAGGTTFAIKQAGAVGAGLTVRDNTLIDRRPNPLMTYGVSATGTSPVRLRGNSVHGQVTGTHTGSAVSYEAPPPSATLITATNATWPIPAEANFLEIICVGAGGSGGGGGAATGTTLQVGGAGGSPGGSQGQVVAVGANTTLNVTVGAGGTPGGTAGTAPGGAAGNGSNGADTTVTGTGISVRGHGGSRGNGSLGNSTTQAFPGTVWGTNSGQAASAATQFAMVGGANGSKAGWPVGWSGGGGGGGAAASATNGGNGGSAGTTDDGGAAGSGTTGSSTGGTGGNGAANTGTGGGGGGGGAAGTGNGGVGGTGGSGLVIIKVVG